MKYLFDFVEILKNQNNLIEFSGENIEIKGITFDSNEVEDGSLFFCKGVKFKDEYLQEAKEKGAVAYISERKMDVNLPFILVKDVRLAMLELARFFYDYPDLKLKTIAVTGTKGKSTTVTYIKSVLDAHLKKIGKKPAGISSTINIYDGTQNISASFSTPEALTLYKYLYNAVNAGLEYMIIEASSQAFKYNRLTNMEFDVAVFLNIGEDHVGELEHPTLEDYFNSKLKIFDQAKFGIYNKSSDKVEKIEKHINDLNLPNKSFSMDKNSDITFISYNFVDNGLNFEVEYDGEKVSLHIPQQGVYNIDNAMATFLVAKYFEISNETIREGLKEVEVEGREKIYKTKDEKFVFIANYAHNELSLDKTFEFISQRYSGYRVVTFFGNNQNMAENRIVGNSRSAAKNSDYVYIVPDDSGYVGFEKISQRLSSEVSKYTNRFEAIDSREDAAWKAYRKALNKEEKVVFFLAGKGDEDFQKGPGYKIPIKSDYDVAKEIVEEYNRKF